MHAGRYPRLPICPVNCFKFFFVMVGGIKGAQVGSRVEFLNGKLKDAVKRLR